MTLPAVFPPLDLRPRLFKPHLFYKFHRSVSHSTNGCFTLRNAVQDLIDAGIIGTPIPMSPPPIVLRRGPSLPASPLKPPLDTPPVGPVHHFALARQGSPPKERRGRRAKSDYALLVAPLSIVFPKVAPYLSLPKVRPPPDPLPHWYDAGLYCAYHWATGHTTDGCFTL